MLISQTDTAGTLYFLPDAQGSTRALIDSNGALGQTYDYDAFGNLQGDYQSGLDTSYLYTGQQFDDVSGLYSLRARYYDPSLGRFLSRDTYPYNYQNPFELNRYVYTANNPATWSDPSGYSVGYGAIVSVSQSLTANRAGAIYGGAMGAAYGTIAGFFSAATMDFFTRNGACGDRVPSLDRESYIRAAMIGGAIAGGILGAARGAGGIWAAGANSLIVGTATVTGTKAMAELAKTAFSGGGFNVCAGIELALSVLAIKGISSKGSPSGNPNSSSGSPDLIYDARLGQYIPHSGGSLPPSATGGAIVPTGGGAITTGTGGGIMSWGGIPATSGILGTQVGSGLVPCNSFSADTTVETPHGDIAISEIEVGDTVIAYNEETRETGEYTVTDTMQHEDDAIVTLTINGEEIETTPWHLFYTDEGWVEAEELEVGDAILSLGGVYGSVDSILIEDRTQMMYDLTVEEVHTFAVGDGDWVVHNCGSIITYGDLDQHGRPTVVSATLDGSPPLGEGKKIAKTWRPPELDTTVHDRTHLIAREFGGRGHKNNRVIGYRSINQRGGAMRNFEEAVGDALRNGETIRYVVSPIYPVGSKTLIPDFIVMEAYGNMGTHMIEVIPNRP